MGAAANSFTDTYFNTGTSIALLRLQQHQTFRAFAEWGTTTMMGAETKDRWKELCAAAVREHDPQKFLVIIRDLNDALEARERGLTKYSPEAFRNQLLH
jgi:hypothetical protein